MNGRCLSNMQIQTTASFHLNLAALSDAKKRLEDNYGWDLGSRLCDYGMIKNLGENVKQAAEEERVRFVSAHSLLLGVSHEQSFEADLV